MKTLAMAACLLLAVNVTHASAQASAVRARGPEIDLGAVWTRGGAYGSANANLTTPAGTPQPLFTAATSLGAEIALDARLAFRVAGPLRAEVSGTWGRADLRSHITGDFEGAAPVTVSDRLTVFTIQGAGIWYFHRRGKLEPFVRAGAGWMRELTTDAALAGDGRIANAGAGVKYWWFERDRGWLKRLGLRSDARVVGRFGGLELGTKDRLIAPAVGVNAIIGF
jgi:hypothetical protein